MIDLECIGKNLAQLRKQHDLTQGDVANALKVTTQAVSKGENGINLPEVSLLVALSKLLRSSVDELLLNDCKSVPDQFMMRNGIGGEITHISIRAVGVTVKNGCILVQREKDGNEYALPGGTVEFGETTEDTLKREHKEEMESDIAIERLLWTEETFWEFDGSKHHSIAFYYLTQLLDDSRIPQVGEFVSQKDNCDVILGWMPIHNLNDIIIYPAFLKDEIHNINGEIKHFISKE